MIQVRLYAGTAFLFASLGILAVPCQAETFTAKVVAVDDGDTIDVLHNGEVETVRLNGIDCPEKNQLYGKKAKKFTSDRVLNKIVKVESKTVDAYGRTIGDVTVEESSSLNHELLKEGLAWWFFRYSKDETLKNLEMEAREGKRGLWRDPIPIPPWVFRKIQHKTVPELSDFQYPDTVPSAVLANKKSKLYRYLGCRQYEAMAEQKNVIGFEGIQAAIEEGYHAAKDCPKELVKP